MAFRFEELKVGHKAVDPSNAVDLLVKKFPKTEMYSLTSPIKSAAYPVVLNIAIPEFKRFLDIALGSAIEVAACLFFAVKRNYTAEDEFKNLYANYEVLCKMITKLRDPM